jgi:predicted P-loop ATPase
LTNTPIRQNLLTGQIEVHGTSINISHEEIEFQNRHNVRHLNFEQVINNEASKNIYNPIAEKLIELYFQTTEEEEEESRWRGGSKSILREYKNRFVANYQAKTNNINATYSDVFPPLPLTLETIEEFITSVFHIDDKWYIESIKHMMISAVARAIDPGCKVDTVTIFKSTQGFSKSEMIRHLAYEKYYVAKRGNSISQKDDLMESARGWIQEYGEIDKITASRCSSETKDNFSRSIDVYRKPYAKVADSYPRHWIDIGTTNEDILFLDVDNRRYNVVELQQEIDKDFLIKYRDSAWAIATQLYFNGEKWWFDEKDEGAKVRKERNLQYRYVDFRSEAVLDLVPNNSKYVSPECIATLLEGGNIGNFLPSKKSVDDATNILKKSGWEKAKGRQRIATGQQRRNTYLNPNFKKLKK